MLLGITCGMATLFHKCSLLGFVPLEALEGLSTQRVWHGAPPSGDRDRVKCARRSRAIHYKINDDLCGFHPVLYATQFREHKLILKKNARKFIHRDNVSVYTAIDCTQMVHCSVEKKLTRRRIRKAALVCIRHTYANYRCV